MQLAPERQLHSDDQTSIYQDAGGFPKRAVLRGAAVQTRQDLLSLIGVPILAVVGAVATAVFPRPHSGLLGHPVVHDPIAIVAGLAVLEASWLAIRYAVFRPASRRRYQVDGAMAFQFARFNVFERSAPDRPLPPVWFVVRTPDGKHISALAHPPDSLFPRGLPPGPSAQILGAQHLHGRYEVRVYTSSPVTELARKLIDL